MKVNFPFTGIFGINKEFLPENFKFTINGHDYWCNKIIADVLSPCVSKIHQLDPSTEQIVINIKETNKNFQLFNDLINTGCVTVDTESMPFFLKVAQQLENDQLVSKLINRDESTKLSNIFSRLAISSCRAIPDNEINEVIDFAASNFYSLDYGKITKLPLEQLNMILGSDALKIKSEDWLLNFIVDTVKKQGDELSYLLCYVDFTALSSDGMEQFLHFFNISDITEETWSKIAWCLISNLSSHETPVNTSRYHENEIFKTETFKPDKDNIFNGIINYLNNKSEGICSENGTIEVNESSHMGGLKSTQLFDYSNLSSSKTWSVNKELNGFLEIDFKDKSVNLTHYSIHTPNVVYGKFYPKTWTVEGSNDKITWTVLDNRLNDDNLTEPNLSHLFKCNCTVDKEFKFIRIYQRGENHGGNLCFWISGIEFYGKLIKKPK